jgi:hypothetical protein
LQLRQVHMNNFHKHMTDMICVHDSDSRMLLPDKTMKSIAVSH